MAVNDGRRRAAFAAAGLLLAFASAATALLAQGDAPECSPRLTALFAPADPERSGAYEVCRSPLPIAALAVRLGLASGDIAPTAAADAFAGAPSRVRRRLALLYGGQPVAVTRSWRRQPPFVEAVTLIAPAPDATLRTITGGTLMIVQRRSDPAAAGAR